MSKSNRYSPEYRERAVRMVFEHQSEYPSQWAAMNSIATKMGCTTETLRKWLRQCERDQGLRAGLTSDEREQLKALEREVRELKRANEILRKASSRSAGNCRLPRQRITSTRHGKQTRNGCRHAYGEMKR